MSDSMKTKYEVQKILSDCIKEGLVTFGIKKTVDGVDSSLFDVIEYGQPKMWQMDRCIAINYMRHERIGWQGVSYVSGAWGMTRVDDIIEQQTWYIHVVMKRKESDPSPTLSTITTEDVMSYIISWFNGPGQEMLRRNKVSSLRLDPADIIVYNDNSDVYQKRAVIKMNLLVPKEFSFGQEHLVALDVETWPI